MINKIIKFMKYDYFLKKEILENSYYRFKTVFFYKKFFKEIGNGSIIKKPLRLTPKCITIKNNVVIFNNGRVEGVFTYAGEYFFPEIIINNGVSIQQNLHLTCANKIEIGENVAIAANVTITDINHNYVDITTPIEQQKLDVGIVKIGENSKIYNNSVILPNVAIGKHCVIGANSVVNKDIPDYSVAVGSPAKIVKRYNIKTEKWEKTNEMGEFLDD